MMHKILSTSPKARYFAEPHPHKRLYRYHQTMVVHGQLFASIFSSIAIMMGVAYWLSGPDVESYKALAVINGLLIYTIYQLLGVYHQSNGILLGRRRNFVFGLWVLSKAWVLVVLSMTFFTFITKTSADYSRTVFIIWSIVGLFVQAGLYYLVYLLSKKYLSHFSKPIPTLIIGANGLGKQLINKLHNNAWLTEKVIGVVEDSPEAKTSWNHSSPILGETNQIREIIQRYNIKRVYITLLLSQSDKIEEIISELDNQCVDIIWIPDTLSITTINKSIRELSGLPLLVLSGSPMKSVKAILTKSILDKVIAFTMLLLLLPLLIAVALAIKFTSPGPVIYKQKRHGWDGKEIEIWKFRSMYSEGYNSSKMKVAQRDDPRVTPVGKFIRKTSIDELPQLFNVLQGRMSVVGPRPHAIEMNQFYSRHIPNFMLRHRIKPGITGLAQVYGFRGGGDFSSETPDKKTLDQMKSRANLDIEYINHWSLFLDLKILLLTPVSLFSYDVY